MRYFSYRAFYESDFQRMIFALSNIDCWGQYWSKIRFYKRGFSYSFSSICLFENIFRITTVWIFQNQFPSLKSITKSVIFCSPKILFEKNHFRLLLLACTPKVFLLVSESFYCLVFLCSNCWWELLSQFYQKCIKVIFNSCYWLEANFHPIG